MPTIGVMRPTNFLVVVLFGLVGCAGMASNESRGQTARQLAGHSQLLFTNATPAKMCALYISFDDGGKFGDNWLPKEGLASGATIELNVKAGKYQATWNTCKQGKAPYFAGTLINDTAFMVGDPTQLFAYVADNVAPTKRAKPRVHHTLVRFSGQEVLPYGTQVARAPAVPREPIAVVEAPPPPKVDLSAFIDQKLVRKTRLAAAPKKGQKGQKPLKPQKPSLKRVHDIAQARAGYIRR